MTKTVVVLGGSLGGMAVTHRLLKYTRPHEEDLKVVLVSKVKNLAFAQRPLEAHFGRIVTSIGT